MSILGAQFEPINSSIPDISRKPSTHYLQISQYESISHNDLLKFSQSYLANAYTIRKALIRKHYLAHTVDFYSAKNPSASLKNHVPLTLSFELDYAEFLEEALVEAYELHESWSRNEDKPAKDREWWILKPSMSDRGQGIRLFSTEEELQYIFEEWEPGENEDDEDETSENGTEGYTLKPNKEDDQDNSGVMTSQLRHFVVQPYIPPLLLPSLNNRKFHIRTYVLAVGALRVYVYREMLALFSAITYISPGTSFRTDSTIDLGAHLTNTCLQDGSHEGSVHNFWDLPSSTPNSRTDWKEKIFKEICEVTGTLFRAAAAQPTNFQTLPNAFEIFGIDWLVDETENVWLLEVNAFPDFRQTGDDLKDVIRGLWKGVFALAVAPFFGVDVEKDGGGDGDWGMHQVLDLDLGRR